MELKDIQALAYLLSFVAVVAMQFAMVKYAVSELKKEVSRIADMVNEEREKRHELEKRTAEKYVQRDVFAYELSRLEAKLSEAVKELKALIKEVKNDREAG
ncbi:hypothetical protein [Hydrogenobacter thermophilus]|uniref:hypothetical protein n=1 Tax=Hydrogenobacter thermophilus TaxID=940 RepID=UPI0030FCAA87